MIYAAFLFLVGEGKLNQTNLKGYKFGYANKS